MQTFVNTSKWLHLIQPHYLLFKLFTENSLVQLEQ